MSSLLRRGHFLLGLLVAVPLLLAACAPRTGAPVAPAGPAPAMGAPTVGDFYRGKTISIIVGYAPGGGFDTTARLLAKHMGNHLPGNPNLIVENMPGAGSLTAANHLYNVAKRDGLTIGVFNEVQMLNQVTGTEGVQFDARKFGWLGNALQSTTTCTIRSDAPYRTSADLLRKDLPPLIVGGTAPGANTDDLPKLMNAVLGTNFRVVSGYEGTSHIRLATESGEVQGMCWSYESVVATAKHWLDGDFITVPIYNASQRDSKVEERFPNAVRAEDLATDPQAKQLLRALAAPATIAKPFTAPPGVPAERLQALREAFGATMKDPAFLADAEQSRMEIDPNPAAKTEQIVNELLSLPPELVARLKEILK